ncbi:MULTISPECIES: germination protein YpeB [unclassified Bacillus (in: firmicutes)]|uniref:germination protein YpeB n=1 Tax=unclassified Bacillus (in: firmicutes) TaxID=185979 RepID=UPI00047C46E8|nr:MULTISPECIES: germination protein YpeB [unclassified Bacillus (in: firmicutes)]SDY85763.1 spore germination protein [Bacillus sp. 166amftsu]
MLRGIIIVLLTIGVVGTGYWGYKEHQEKNAVLIRAENSYQRAFHDLAYEVDLLHDKIGTTLAMNSRTSLSPALADVWRLTSEARSDVGQLPLTLMPFNKTEEFLANIGDFSYRTAIRDLEKEPLNDQEYKALQGLYSNAADIQDELRKVQHLVLKNNLRWMDVELALASDKDPADNTIIDGLKTVEKNVTSYSSDNFGPTFTSMQKAKKGGFEATGKAISKDEAAKIAKSFLNLKGDEKVEVEKSGKGAKESFYSVKIQDPKTKNEFYMDITEKGGYPIWVMNNREIKEQKISLHDAGSKGLTFLKDHKFTNMELFDSSQYDNIGVFTYVVNENDVRIYPEAIQMKIALDDGSIVGFSAKEYLASHQKRTIPAAKLTAADARKKINPDVKVMEERKAIIVNATHKEVLCYEFVGTLGKDTYQIFINANDGTEEKVKKMQAVEKVYD